MQINNRTIAEIISLVAIILSVLFLAQEIRQSNRIAISAAESGIRAMASDTNRTILELSENSALLEKLVVPGSEFTPSEEAMARMLARQFANLWASAQSAYSNGFISEYSYQVYLNDPIIHFEEYPGLLPHFSYLMKRYEGAETTAMAEEIRNQLRIRGYDN